MLFNQGDIFFKSLNNNKKIRNLFFGGSVAEKRLFTPGVHDDGSIGMVKQIPESRHVFNPQGIDDRNPRIGLDLDQTQLGTVRILRNKFGVEC